MGGLMLRAALMVHGKELWKKVGKIVFISDSPLRFTIHCRVFEESSVGLGRGRGSWQCSLAVKLFDRCAARWSPPPAPKGIYPGTRNGEETSLRQLRYVRRRGLEA